LIHFYKRYFLYDLKHGDGQVLQDEAPGAQGNTQKGKRLFLMTGFFTPAEP